MDQERIYNCLSRVIDDNTGQPLDVSSVVKECHIADGVLSLTVELAYPAAGYKDALLAAIKSASAELNIDDVQLDIKSNIVARAVQNGVALSAGIKNIIAIASGKGGVGKSTTAINLALALQAEGAIVGILDADIYGPSQPRMLGCHDKPESVEQKKIKPVSCYQLQSMSIGYLIEEDTPMIWRGPMVTSALQQLFSDTQWHDLDYLIIDLPPGTGDVQLTLCQKIPVTGAVIVTTPQDIAAIDARKSLQMFNKVNVAVLGVVENMSLHICSECGHEEAIFGHGGGQQMAGQYNVELLGSLPLDSTIRADLDKGKPTVIMQPTSPITRIYRAIARKLAARLSLQPKDYSARFPKIVVQNNEVGVGR